jgi:parvulin-like peptidyl-prolyl isomerase
MQRFPWRFAVYLIAGLYLFVDLALWKGPLHERLTRPWDGSGDDAEGQAVAMVYGRAITRLELAEALRGYLWRRGETWAGLSETAQKMTRAVVLEQLINDRLVRAFRVMNRLEAAVPEALAEREVEMMRRQFPEAGEWEQRLSWQARTEAEFAGEAREALADEAWIEEKIRHRLVEVTEAVVREWYDLNQESLTVPERYWVAHLYLSAHDPEKRERAAEVAAISARLVDADEASFTKTVAELSEDERTKRRGGDLGWFSAARMPADFVESVRGMTVGRTSAVVKTALGWHWVRVKSRQPARVPAFEEVKEEIRAALEGERRELAVKALMSELRLRSVKPTRFLHVFDEVVEGVEAAGER